MLFQSVVFFLREVRHESFRNPCQNISWKAENKRRIERNPLLPKSEVGEKTWQDWRLSASFLAKADNRPCWTFGSPVKLASNNGRINTRDANILPYLNKL